ncbi:MAG: glycosyltransferase family 2 protein [Nitrospirota bacterium]
MSMPATSRRVSVIIPTYNRAHYLKKSVKSALRQTYGNLEVIVVDDGSTDNTRAVLQPYIDDRRIIYLYQNNAGSPAKARNRGLRAASGDYIAFLDSDDVRMPESIERSVALLDASPEVGMVCADWLNFKRYHSVRRDRKPSWITKAGYIEKLPDEFVRERGEDFLILGEDFIYELFNTNFVFTSSVVTRRALLDRVGWFDESLTIGEDCDLWMRICEVAYLAFLTSPLVYRRVHRGSITSSLARNIMDDTRVLEKFMSKRRPLQPYVKKRFHRRLENFYSRSGYFFFTRNNLAESRKRFMRAIRYNPSAYAYYRYFALSLMPMDLFLLAKRLKQRMSRSEYA